MPKALRCELCGQQRKMSSGKTSGKDGPNKGTMTHAKDCPVLTYIKQGGPPPKLAQPPTED